VADPLDLVREFYRALNRHDIDAVVAFYHPDGVLERVFAGETQVHQGRERIAAWWAHELETRAGALAGGHRIDVRRIAGIETGWGWVRSDWVAGWRSAGDTTDRFAAGHSFFWVDGGLICRHRSVGQPIDGLAARDSSAVPDRAYPSRPVVGVGGVILDRDGRVVLVRRRHEPLAGQWSLPGGMLELGETLEAGTAREMLEETGLVVDLGPVIEVFDRILVDDRGAVRFHFVLVDYLCRPRAGALAGGTDVDEATLADPDDLSSYAVTEKVRAVVARAVALNRGDPW